GGAGDGGGGAAPVAVGDDGGEPAGLHVVVAETHVAAGGFGHAALGVAPAEHRIHDPHDLPELVVADALQAHEPAGAVDDAGIVQTHRHFGRSLLRGHIQYGSLSPTD